MKFGIARCVALSIVATLVGALPTLPASAVEAESGFDNSVRLFAATVLRPPKQSWAGYGIYLGQGRILTAAHVAGSRFAPSPEVRIAGRLLPSKIVKEGQFETVDLSLLAIDEQMLPPSLGLRLMPVCDRAPRIGQNVVVATPEASAHSSIMSPLLLPAEIRQRFDTVIPDVQTTGNSGSGVFDPEKQCLMGIMSRKIQIKLQTGDHSGEMRDLAKYFVPAAAIRQFLSSP